MLSVSQECQQHAVTVAALAGDPLKRIFSLLDTEAICCAVQELIKHDNKASAWPVIDLAAVGRCSSWRYNRPRRFFQCRLIALQLDRNKSRLRLCFDVRGEIDLRHPATSQVALVADRPDSNFNPGGMMQPDYDDLLRTYNFDGVTCHLCGYKQGHYKGWLEWSIQHAALPNGKFPMDISLVFCYANPVAQSPQQYLEADYLGAELLKIPAGVTFEEAFLAQCTSYELPYAPEQRLAAQSEEEEQALWHSLPEEVQARWGVLPRGPISSAQPDV